MFFIWSIRGDPARFCLLVVWSVWYKSHSGPACSAQRVQFSMTSDQQFTLNNACLPGMCRIINTAIIGGRRQPVSHISQAWKDACLLSHTVAMVIMNDGWWWWAAIDFLSVIQNSILKWANALWRWALVRQRNKHRVMHYALQGHTCTRSTGSRRRPPRQQCGLLREGNDITAQTQEE